MNKLLFIPLSLLVGCSSSEPPSDLMQGKFNSMEACLEKIKKDSGYNTLRPMTDKPDHVSGYLGDSDFDFNCEVKHTGTEGTFVEGWYEKQKQLIEISPQLGGLMAFNEAST